MITWDNWQVIWSKLSSCHHRFDDNEVEENEDWSSPHVCNHECTSLMGMIDAYKEDRRTKIHSNFTEEGRKLANYEGWNSICLTFLYHMDFSLHGFHSILDHSWEPENSLNTGFPVISIEDFHHCNRHKMLHQWSKGSWSRSELRTSHYSPVACSSTHTEKEWRETWCQRLWKSESWSDG